MRELKPTFAEEEVIRKVGGKRVMRNGVVTTVPAISPNVLRKLPMTVLPEATGFLQGHMKSMGFSKQFVDALMEGKKVVKRPSEAVNGEMEWIMVDDIPGLKDAPLSEFSGTDEGYRSPRGREVIDDVARSYSLEQIFGDASVSDKLAFSARTVQRARLLALDDAAEAARMLEAILRDRGYPNYRVRAGNYVNSRNKCKALIRKAYESLALKDIGIDSTIVGDQIFLYHTEDGTPSTQLLWTLSAPIQNIKEARSIFQLAVTNGPQETIFMFGVQTTMLNIQIQDYFTDLYYAPVLTGHADVEGVTPFGTGLPENLTAEQTVKLNNSGKRVLPVQLDGKVVGSAVRVTDKHLLVNEHTLALAASTTEFRIAGKSFLRKTSISQDLWIVEQKGETVQWPLRTPVVGERVVFCFNVGNGIVEYSEPVRVATTDANTFTVARPRVARPGTSGAAIIALTDMSLLGLYSGPRHMHSLCCTFSSHHFGQMLEFDSNSTLQSVEVLQDTVGDSIYEKLDRKGLSGTLQSIADSMVTMHCSKRVSTDGFTMVGVAADFAGGLHTTINPDYIQMYYKDGRPLSFERSGPERYASWHRTAGTSPVCYTRKVELGERVFLFTKKDDDIYFSKSFPVDLVGTSSAMFTMDDVGANEIPFSGALVVAERDAAVVGQFVSVRTNAYGQTETYCLGLPKRAVSTTAVDPLTAIIDRFPYLNVVEYQDKLLDVMTHVSAKPVPSGAASAYAKIGDTVFKLVLWRHLQRIGTPVTEWQQLCSKLQTNARFSSLFHELGLTSVYRKAIEISTASKVYADALEGIAGVIFEHDSYDSFLRFVDDIGLHADIGGEAGFVKDDVVVRTDTPVNNYVPLTVDTLRILDAANRDASPLSGVSSYHSLH